MDKSRITSFPRTVARVLRSRLEGALHGGRYRRARKSLESAPAPSRILVVCLGNICRSPYGERVLRRMLAATEAPVTVTSAGFEPPGRESPEMAVSAAGRRGVDLSEHRSRILSVEEVRSSDLVLVMEPRQRRALGAWFGPSRNVLVLGDLDPERIRRRPITDPYGGNADVFDAAFARIDRCLGVVVNAIEAPEASVPQRESFRG